MLIVGISQGHGLLERGAETLPLVGCATPVARDLSFNGKGERCPDFRKPICAPQPQRELAYLPSNSATVPHRVASMSRSVFTLNVHVVRHRPVDRCFVCRPIDVTEQPRRFGARARDRPNALGLSGGRGQVARFVEELLPTSIAAMRANARQHDERVNATDGGGVRLREHGVRVFLGSRPVPSLELDVRAPCQQVERPQHHVPLFAVRQSVAQIHFSAIVFALLG